MSDAPFRELFNAIEEGVCILEVIFDDQGNCFDYRHVEVNAAFERQTGLINGVGKRMRELFPDMENYWPNLYGQVARTGLPVKTQSFFSGLNRWFSVHATRIGGPGSCKVGVIFSDSTAGKQAEQRTAFLEDLSGRLSSVTSEAQIVAISTGMLGQFLKADRCYFVECLPAESLVIVGKNWLRDDASSVEGRLALHDFGGMDWWRQYSAGDFAVENVETHPLTREKSANYLALRIHSYAVQPFRNEGQWTTVLGVTNRTPRKWSAEDLSLMNDVVARVWPMVERARAEAKLRASETNYREMLSRLPVACYTLDAGGTLTFFNAAAVELWGRTPELGKELWCGSYAMQSLDGKPIPLDQCPAAVALRTQKPVRGIEAYVERPDGSRRLIIPHPDPIFDAEGKCVGLINVMVDITDQRTAETKVRENAGFLQSVISASYDCIKVLDLNGRMRWMSENGMRVMEVCEFSTISGAYWPDFWKDPITRQEVLTAVKAAVEGGVSRFRGFCLTAAGNPRWWDVIVSPILGSDGQPVQILSVSRDVTAVREIEQALLASRTDLEQHAQSLQASLDELRVAKAGSELTARALAESAQRFQLLSEVVALQVWTATVTGELDFVNRECLQYFGVSTETDLLGTAWARFVHADDIPTALATWTESLATGRQYETKFRLRGGDGVYRWFLSRAESMRDADGRILKWIGSNTDVDELKRVQDAAERANAAKDDFLAALSHELRTPLMPVLMTATELRLDERLPQEVREQLTMIERNITLEARLIDDLLDLTKIAHGKLQLLPEPSDVHSLIGQALEIVREDARAKNITIKRNYQTKRSEIVVDPARFQQVMWNLLRNAVKFAPRDGQISVATREKAGGDAEGWLQIVVTDSGIGIEPAMLETIFRPFDQGHLKGSHRFGGLGLGLAIARAVVDSHGGRISAHSEGQGQGATFTVELPGAMEPRSGVQQIPAANPVETANTAPAPRRLLVVEDHEHTLRALMALLKKDGHSVTPASSVGEALNACETSVFDFVISDLGLPDGTGIELMQKLRDKHGLKGLALSGYGMENDLARSREAGFVAHLIKPIQFAELRRAIHRLASAES